MSKRVNLDEKETAKEPVAKTKKKLTKTEDAKTEKKTSETPLKSEKKSEKIDTAIKHKYPKTRIPSKSGVTMYVSKECQDLLWASIHSRR